MARENYELERRIGHAITLMPLCVRWSANFVINQVQVQRNVELSTRKNGKKYETTNDGNQLSRSELTSIAAGLVVTHSFEPLCTSDTY